MKIDIASTLTSFIVEDLLQGKVVLAPDTKLFTSRLLNSIALVELLAFIEEEFAIKIKPSEILIENIDSVKFFEHFIQRKLHEQQTS